ncbi:hypothetical protein EVJ58_g7624 [Rhodofomes roseus]|uniref:Uncharacterized protein n=1 Tax=Rhodofomes roseus TaxID=34475 RepID=A0A4Y9Y4F8_9APHY|nr:hypothetical protein EVJ58_g7624 [Rhodofomes roseus]
MYTESTSHVDEGVGEDQVDLTNADNSLRSDSDEGLDAQADPINDDYSGPGRVSRSLQGSLPPNLSDRIPLDIIESIIDCMVQTMLLPTAHVCHAWYPRAMHNLYSTIRLHSRRCYDLLVRQMRTSPRLKQWLATTDGLIVTQISLEHERDLPFLDALPLVFADTLPALRVLSIEGALRPAMHPSFLLGLLQFKHIVSALRLVAVALSNITQLQQIVYACPHITELGLNHVTLIHTAPVGWGSSRSAHIRSRTESSTSLRRLDFKMSARRDSELASELVADWLVYSVLQHLCLLA